MKVAFFLGGLNRGGTESLILDICRNKNIVPFDFVVLYRKEGNYSDAFRATDATFIHLPKHGNMLKYILSIRQCIAQNHIDIIHSQTPSNSLLCVLAKIGLPVKLYTSFHGLSFSHANWLQRKVVMKCSDRLVFVSQYIRDLYLQTNSWIQPDKCEVVYDAMDFSKVAEKRERERESERESGPMQPRLGMVGSFNYGRDHLFLCKALKELNAQGIDFHFDFVGGKWASEPACYDDCVRYCNENGLADKVSFLGMRTDVYDIMQTWDGVVYSTKCDTFGISILEAVAMGLPTLVNDWQVFREISNNGEFLRMWKTGDIEDCVQAITRMITDRPSVADCQHYASLVRSRFGIEKHIAKLNEIYGAVSREGKNEE